MTTMARPKRDFVLSTRAPYAPIVMLIGALVVIGVVIRLLNTSPPADPASPLSGAPVGDGEAPVVVTDPAAQAARGSLSLLMPVRNADEPMAVGPGAFPAGSAVVLSVVLPTQQPTSVKIGLARMKVDGTMQPARPISVEVKPDENGAATVKADAATLTEELGAGLYHVTFAWDDQKLTDMDVALGQSQPANVAIFDESRHVLFAAGSYTGVQLDANGAVAGEKPYRLDDASGAPAAAFGMVNGQPHLYITKGVWGGYWVAMTEGVTLE